MFLQTRGVHTFIMHKSELADRLKEIQEKGFDDSFAEFCADTFSSYEYPKERLAAARMHAHFLRVFIQEYLTDPCPEERQEDYMRVGMAAIDEVLEGERPTAMAFCRAFVEKWCRFCAG